MRPPRIVQRLQREYETMINLREQSSLITFTPQGFPPTRYDLTFSCRGLCRHEDRICTIARHEFYILLGENYPTMPPEIVWKTPIFHPNFRQPQVCLGDYWYPGSSISEICIALCEMVQYKTFNIYDPLDLMAAAWVLKHLEANASDFPIDCRPVRDLNFEIAKPYPPDGV